IKARGLRAFQGDLCQIAPFLKNRVSELDDWEKIKLLTVRVDRMEDWAREGLLCIGDCAHAMSPVGGVGINLAIQDAVAAANILMPSLIRGDTVLKDLKKVQARRLFPTKLTQFAQIQIHKRILTRVLHAEAGPMKTPLPVKLARYLPFVRRIPARLIGIGVRP